MIRRLSLVATLFVIAPCLAFGGAIVRSASGPSPAFIAPVVDQFRADLGSTNNGVGGTFPSGHREINWDGVPDSFAAPNKLPANFFNVNSPRGAILSTPGSGFEVSAKTGNPTVTALRFGNLNANYLNDFQTFSPERLFVALDSNVTDVTFFVPGTTTTAFVSGFGAIFTDVDFGNTTTMQFFDPVGVSLGTFAVPSQGPGSQSMSFLGVFFNGGEKVARVRIVSGNVAPGAPDNHGAGQDAVAMDDFFYGEPQSLQAGCAADATTLCLNGGRFKVQVTFRLPPPPPPAPPQQPLGQASAVGMTGDTGVFYFFTPNNLELMVKVVDGRAVNNRFWVFIGATSNVEYTVTVTDLATGSPRIYTNPQGTLTSYADLNAF